MMQGKFGVFTKPKAAYKGSVECEMNLFSSGIVQTINDGTASYNLIFKISGVMRFYAFSARSEIGERDKKRWQKAPPNKNKNPALIKVTVGVFQGTIKTPVPLGCHTCVQREPDEKGCTAKSKGTHTIKLKKFKILKEDTGEKS